jgi:predicted DNA-binding mobile mystery protein A
MRSTKSTARRRLDQLERAEVDGSIRFSTLERAAEALSCRLQYVLIPAEPLEAMVRGQARAKAATEVAATTQNMRLEDQAPEADVIREQIDALAEDLIDTRGLWRPTHRSA